MSTASAASLRDPVERGHMGAADADAAVRGRGPDTDDDVVAVDVLVQLGVGEAGQAQHLALHGDLDLRGARVGRGLQRGLGQRPRDRVARLLAWPCHQPEPTVTSRKRAGAAPCATRATCDGWPLPQLGVP